MRRHEWGLLVHTVRHLRVRQVLARGRLRLYRPVPKPLPAPERRRPMGEWSPPAPREPSLLAPATFRFLNETRSLAEPGHWNHPAWEKLWLYNLHYFDDLNAQGAERRADWHRALIARWTRENPPASGNGWEPYPLSLRICNWVKWSLAGNRLEPAWLDSLAVQVRYLARRLEYHLLGNHLFENARALVFAGLFFSGREAERWLAKGLAVLRRELPEQVLADGGHFERSPMYHALVLEGLLDLVNLDRAFPGVIPEAVRSDWDQAVDAMRRWLAAMVHPDGEIAFFNDAAFGIAPNRAALEAYAQRLGYSSVAAPGEGVTHLADSGYVRMQHGEGVALLDAAPVGPDYLPGHAHADTLSLELSLFGQRVIVNSGTSCYGTGHERQRQRATAAHSTVEVDGEDSSEVWGGFRVARRARPFDLRVEAGVGSSRVLCAHDGYMRLPGRPVHRRNCRLTRHGLWIRDEVDGRFRRAVARFHFHPGVTVVPEASAAEGYLLLAEGAIASWSVTRGAARVRAGSYHPAFGVSQPNYCLELEAEGNACEVSFSWRRDAHTFPDRQLSAGDERPGEPDV